MMYDKNDVYLYVGENIRFLDDTRYTKYNYYTCISGKESNLYFNSLDDRVERFEEGANVIRFDQTVYDELKTIRIQNDNELEIGLSDGIVRSVKGDFAEMTQEFSFTTEEAYNRIKKYK